MASTGPFRGEPAPLEIAWPEAADPDQARAYFAAIALGEGDSLAREHLADAAERRADAAAVSVSQVALGRIEAGCRLSVIG